MEKLQSHLTIIQGVISRLAQNSFLIKGWSITLTSALFALAASKSNTAYVFLAYFPAITFWILDGYYLWQEKLFRALFDKVRHIDEEKIDYSMSTSTVKDAVGKWGHLTFSKTLIIFHGTIVCSIIIVMITLLTVVRSI